MNLVFFLVIATCFVAYSNGANDNFKGVATLFGSGTAGYRRALGWASVATVAGAVCSVFWAEALVQNFSGKGLVPDSVAASPDFLLAVAGGAGLTVMLATMFGFPVSTTHGLTGALLGGGMVAAGAGVQLGFLGRSFLLPLLLSPLVAVMFAGAAYPIFRYFRRRLGVTKEWCLCAGRRHRVGELFQPVHNIVIFGPPIAPPNLRISLGPADQCIERYSGAFLGISAQKLLDTAHYATAGAVSFARGLNDTPKIVALLIAVEGLKLETGMLAVAIAMVIGGLLNARRVADTISKRITQMNHGQGFTANLVTSVLVIASTRFGLPVSTTHVAVGSLFGIGLITGRGRPRVVSEILLSWLLTLPVAAVVGAVIYWLLGT